MANQRARAQSERQTAHAKSAAKAASQKQAAKPAASAKGYNVSGYFNSAGKPTFANSPQVKGLAKSPTGLTNTQAAAAGTSNGPPPPHYAQPFLQPDQQQALINWNLSYGNQIAALAQGDTNALVSYNQGISDAQLASAQNTQTADADAAARGVFQSGIHDAALNDIAATQARQNNILYTAYTTTLSNDADARTRLNTANTGMQGTFNTEAVQNAQAIPPTPGTPPPAPHPAGAQQAAHNAATPGAPSLPAVAGAESEQAQASNKAKQAAQAQAPTNPFWSQAAGKAWAANIPGHQAPKPPGLGLKIRGPFGGSFSSSAPVQVPR